MLNKHSRESENIPVDKKSELIKMELQKYRLLKNKLNAQDSKPTISVSDQFEDQTASSSKRNIVNIAEILSPQTYQNLLYVKDNNFNSTNKKSIEKRPPRTADDQKENRNKGNDENDDHLNLPTPIRNSVNRPVGKEDSCLRKLRYSIESKVDVSPLFPVNIIDDDSMMISQDKNDLSRVVDELPCESKWSRKGSLMNPDELGGKIPNSLNTSSSRRILKDNTSLSERKDSSRPPIPDKTINEVEKWKTFAKMMAESYEEMQKNVEELNMERSKDKKIIVALKNQVDKLKKLVNLTHNQSHQESGYKETEKTNPTSYRSNSSVKSIHRTLAESSRKPSQQMSERNTALSDKKRKNSLGRRSIVDRSGEDLPPSPKQFTIVPTSEELPNLRPHLL